MVRISLSPKAKWLFIARSTKPLLVFTIILAFLAVSWGYMLNSAFNTPISLIAAISILVWLTTIIVKIALSVREARSYAFELAPKVFKIESGIIRKKYLSIPYARIQNIDICRDVYNRLTKLSDIGVQAIGTTAGYTAYIPGLEPDMAEWLQNELTRRTQD